MPPRPNLFIVGAMKSGTTSLHNYLNTHPDIYMSENKEPGYFVEHMARDRSEDWYLSLFAEGEGCRYVGESSTHYTKLPTYPGVAERIKAFSPQARLFYIMRDPFERLVSHYWHAVHKVEHGGEHRGLCQAVSEEPEYLAFGDYATQLQPYFDTFGREAVYTLTFEEMRSDPARVVNDIFTWLGLPAHDIATKVGEAHNRKPPTIVGVSGFGILNRIQYSKTWGAVSGLVPQGLKDFGKRLAYKQVDEAKIEGEIPALRAQIAGVQRRQIQNLEQLLGRKFPEWSSSSHA